MLERIRRTISRRPGDRVHHVREVETRSHLARRPVGRGLSAPPSADSACSSFWTTATRSRDDPAGSALAAGLRDQAPLRGPSRRLALARRAEPVGLPPPDGGRGEGASARTADDLIMLVRLFPRPAFENFLLPRLHGQYPYPTARYFPAWAPLSPQSAAPSTRAGNLPAPTVREIPIFCTTP